MEKEPARIALLAMMASDSRPCDYLGGNRTPDRALTALLRQEIADGSRRHQGAGAEKDGAHADVTADKSSPERSDHLSDILRRDRVAQNAAGDGLGHIVSDDARDARQQSAERKSHEKAQDNELPSVDDEGLRDQEHGRDGKTDDDDGPMPDAIGELAELR